MEEPHYLCGIAAGRMTKTGKLGFIGSKPLYFIFNNCNGFILGARSVRPDATCQVTITGDWDNPVKEAETVNSLVDQGVDVIVANVDSPKVAIETAERRGVYSCGYHTDLSALGAQWFSNRRGVELGEGRRFRKGLADRRQLSQPVSRRLQAATWSRSARSARRCLRPVGTEVLKARQGFVDDSLKLYKGPLKDNEGNHILPQGRRDHRQRPTTIQSQRQVSRRRSESASTGLK